MTTSTNLAKLAWDQLVAGLVARGLTKVQAIPAAGRQRPDLYEAQIEARAVARELAPSLPHASPIHRYWAAVDQKVAAGAGRYQAILALMKEQPAIVAAYNDYAAANPAAYGAFMAARRV